MIIGEDSHGNKLKIGDYIFYYNNGIELGIVTGFTKSNCLCYLAHYSISLDNGVFQKPTYKYILKTTPDAAALYRSGRPGVNIALQLQQKYDKFKDVLGFTNDLIEIGTKSAKQSKQIDI